MRSRHTIEQKQFGSNISTVFKYPINPASFSCLLVLLTSLAIPQEQARANYQSNAQVENKGSTTIQSPGDHASKAKEPSSDADNTGALDIPQLVREIENNGAAMHRRMRDYTYLLKKTRRILNEQGKATTTQVQSFEAYPVRGEHVLIQLTSNGVALPPWQIELERKRAGERLEKLEQEEKQNQQDKQQRPEGYAGAGVYGRAQGKPVALSIDLSAFLHSCEFSSPRFDRIGERDMIVLNFRPRPGINLPKNKSFVSKLVGSVWIDAADKVVARFEGWPAPEMVKKDEAQAPQNSAARLIYQQVKLPDGMWFPNLIRVNSAGDISVFDGLNWDVLFEFADYKHFTAASEEEVKIRDPQKTP
jgi:hypothetical protein